MQDIPRPKQDQSLGDLFSELAREITTLVRSEFTLAKAEMSQKASRVGKDLGMLLAGGAVAYAGFLALVAAVVALLVRAGLSWWLSALLVGLVVTGTGVFLAMKGLAALKSEDLTPREAIDALKEDRGGANSIRARAV